MHIKQGLIVIAIAAGCSASAAWAGEVTGGPNPKSTPISERANSECAYSGLEDGVTLRGFNPDGSPILEFVETGPGYVQTPHHENSAGVIHEPGLPRLFCRGN